MYEVGASWVVLASGISPPIMGGGAAGDFLGASGGDWRMSTDAGESCGEGLWTSRSPSSTGVSMLSVLRV